MDDNAPMCSLVSMVLHSVAGVACGRGFCDYRILPYFLNMILTESMGIASNDLPRYPFVVVAFNKEL